MASDPPSKRSLSYSDQWPTEDRIATSSTSASASMSVDTPSPAKRARMIDKSPSTLAQTSIDQNPELARADDGDSTSVDQEAGFAARSGTATIGEDRLSTGSSSAVWNHPISAPPTGTKLAYPYPYLVDHLSLPTAAPASAPMSIGQSLGSTSHSAATTGRSGRMRVQLPVRPATAIPGLGTTRPLSTFVIPSSRYSIGPVPFEPPSGFSNNSSSGSGFGPVTTSMGSTGRSISSPIYYGLSNDLSDASVPFVDARSPLMPHTQVPPLGPQVDPTHAQSLDSQSIIPSSAPSIFVHPGAFSLGGSSRRSHSHYLYEYQRDVPHCTSQASNMPQYSSESPLDISLTLPQHQHPYSPSASPLVQVASASSIAPFGTTFPTTADARAQSSSSPRDPEHEQEPEDENPTTTQKKETEREKGKGRSRGVPGPKARIPQEAKVAIADHIIAKGVAMVNLDELAQTTGLTRQQIKS